MRICMQHVVLSHAHDITVKDLKYCVHEEAQMSHIPSLPVAWFLDTVAGVCSLFVLAVQNTVFSIDYNRIVICLHTHPNIYSVKHTLFPEVHSVLGSTSVSSCVRVWTENLTMKKSCH